MHPMIGRRADPLTQSQKTRFRHGEQTQCRVCERTIRRFEEGEGRGENERREEEQIEREESECTSNSQQERRSRRGKRQEGMKSLSA